MKKFLSILILTFIFFFESITLYAQSNIVKKVELLTPIQINILRHWNIKIPHDKKCINKYITSNKGFVLQKSYVVYTNKDKEDGLIQGCNYYEALFYKNNLLYHTSSAGTALSEELVVDLDSKIGQYVNFSIHEAIHGTPSDSGVEYYFINLNSKITKKEVKLSVLNKLKNLPEPFETVFDEFYKK